MLYFAWCEAHLNVVWDVGWIVCTFLKRILQCTNCSCNNCNDPLIAIQPLKGSQFNLPFYVASKFAHHHRNLVRNWMHGIPLCLLSPVLKILGKCNGNLPHARKLTSLLKSLWASNTLWSTLLFWIQTSSRWIYTYVFFDTYKISVLSGSKLNDDMDSLNIVDIDMCN